MAKEITDETFVELVAKWDKQKAQEKKATAARVRTEKAISERLGTLEVEIPEEGATTFTAGDRKLTLTTKINRKIVDVDKLRELESNIPENLRPWEEVTSIKLEPRGLLWLYENEPGLAAVCGEFIEEKAAKANFKVTKIEE